MGLLSRLRAEDRSTTEDRALTRENVPGVMLLYGRHRHDHILDATPANTLGIADGYACVRVLSDSVASLPPRIYRRTPPGRVPVGADQRLAALLQMPSPGATSADLFGCVMADLQTHGNASSGSTEAQTARWRSWDAGTRRRCGLRCAARRSPTSTPASTGCSSSVCAISSTSFNSDQSEIRGKLRAGLIAPNPTAIVKLTGGTAA